jgi:hypothetical protein
MARSRRGIPIPAEGAEALPLHMTFRISPELRKRLSAAAGERPIGEEIRRRLESSFTNETSGPQDPRFADLLMAISHAVAAAARLPTVSVGTRERDDGTTEQYDIAQLGPDITPYVAFREAVETLMNAFEPEGIRAASDAKLIRFANLLVGLALGALGDRGLAALEKLSGRVPRTSLNFSDLASLQPRTAEAAQQLLEVVEAVAAATAEAVVPEAAVAEPIAADEEGDN